MHHIGLLGVGQAFLNSNRRYNADRNDSQLRNGTANVRSRYLTLLC